MTISFNDPAAFALAILYAFLAFYASYRVSRFLTKKPQTGEDRMGNTAGFFVFIILAAIAAVVTLVMLFVGHAGIPALVCCGLVGVAFGMGSRS